MTYKISSTAIVSTPVPPDKERLVVSFRFVWDNMEYRIPPGFQWNGASIPRAFWTTTGSPFLPRYNRASLVHDWFYDNHKVSKKEADKAFRAFLKADGVGWYTRNKMYWAVRMFGKKAWNN